MGAMQSSVNALFASMLGAGFAVSQSPGVKEFREQGNIKRNLAGKEAFLEKAKAEEATDKANVEKALKPFQEDQNPETYEKLKEASESARSSRDLGPTAYEDVSRSYSRLAELTRDPKARAEYYRQGIANEYEAEKMRELNTSFYKDTVRRLMHSYEQKMNVQNAVKERREWMTERDIVSDTLEAAKKDYERRNES